MPWLQGVSPIAESDTVMPGVGERMQHWQACDACVDRNGITIVAEVAADHPGTETILASYGMGIVVLDANQHVIATALGAEVNSSADQLVALVAGDASLGTPVIATTVRVGGHRTSKVWLHLDRVGTGTELVRMFSAVVEVQDGDEVTTGRIAIDATGLRYLAPHATTTESYVLAGQRYEKSTR